MACTIGQRTPQAEAAAYALARHAVTALLDEARLTPKPGLVDMRGSGNHDDMDLSMLEASAESLETAFFDMALAGWGRMPDATLRRQIGAIGREGERVMMKTTGGVNTHRGAIWALGLMVTACAMHEGEAGTDEICMAAASLAKIGDEACPKRFSKGKYVTARYKVPGAREEAQGGFPHVTRLALPQLAASRHRGSLEPEARIDALLAVMTSLADTCVLSRGGMPALAAMQKGARAVLDMGGIGTEAGKRAFARLEDVMRETRASPGGAADLLAATLFLDRAAIQ